MLGYILLQFYIIREIDDLLSYTLELTYLPTIYNELGSYFSPQLSKGQQKLNCALERTLHALSARSWIAPVRGTCSIHSRSASDHGADGAVETGNEHLPHVPRRGVNNSTGRCAHDGLISFRRRAVRRVREGDELGSYSLGGLGEIPRWTYEGRRKGAYEMAVRQLLLMRRRRRRARASTVHMRVHAVQHRSFLDVGPIQCIRALSVSSRGRAHEYISWRHWWMDGATAGMVFRALPQHCTEDARARSQTTSESDSTSYS
ncbi:hypothetical protein LINGRAHAP2_LOCUS32206 [Linum grandiflorum]